MPPHDLRAPTLSRRILHGLLLASALAITLGPTDVRAADDEAPSIGETLVREAADYGWRSWVRHRVYKPSDDERYGLQFDDNWQQCSADLPLVVIVHGFNSTPQKNDGVLAPLREAGFPCAGFAYPNDHTLRESAARLSRELKALARQHPNRRIALVTHSMGGLVARACVEDPALDPGNVTRLIQIAPPNQGTLLAHVAVATDLWEHWVGRRGGAPWTRWRDSIVDGLGEAADDLVPGSEFLATLNARPRNPDVQYAILLGTDASVSADEMDWIRDAVEVTGGRLPGLRSASDRLNNLLLDMEELVDGKGDGVVAVKRGRLAGVADIEVLSFGHLSCTASDSADGPTVQQAILARLR